MDGDLYLLSLLPDEDLVSVLPPGDRLLSLLVGLLILDDDLLHLRVKGVLDLILLCLRGINRPPALSLPLEGDNELSRVPHDLPSCLLESVLLLSGGGDGTAVWLSVLVVVGNLTLGPCLPDEVPAC